MERLQKVLAHAGVASRRQCEELILQRRVRVNGQVVTELGTKVDPTQDAIEVDGQPITLEDKVYILLHKPQGYLSDTRDFRGRPSALGLVPDGERLYPAGRLDARSEGAPRVVHLDVALAPGPWREAPHSERPGTTPPPGSTGATPLARCCYRRVVQRWVSCTAPSPPPPR
jgi:hypothetical protein